MKNSYLYHKVIATLALAMFTVGANAQVSKNKELHKAYKVGQGVNVEIENKYGKVQVNTWDKDSVKIDIKILLRSKTQEKLDKIENNIRFDLVNSGNYVTAKTVFISEKSVFLTEIMNIREYSFGPDDETRIDYVVHMPKNSNLTLTNKFGDIYADNIDGIATINLSHGDLKASDFKGRHTKIDMRYGKANINNITEGDIVAFYATFDIQKAGDINVESKSSEINIYDVNKIKAEAKRDKYYVKKVNSFSATGSFTDFNIDLLREEMIFDTRYGTIIISEVAAGFDYLKLTSKYSDADITFSPNANFTFDMNAEDVNFTYPTSKGKLVNKLDVGDQHVHWYTGKFGTGTASSKVRFNMEDGNLNIKM